VKCYLAFAATVVIVLATTGVWNPFPDVWEWVNQSRPLSSPGVAWQQRLGGSPKSVTIAGNAVVVEHRTTVEARGLSGGVRLWQRDADWGAVAGEDAGAVVVTGELLVKGYDVIDPLSGTVRRHDSGAVAVWTFRNAILDVRCAAARDCTLSAWEPRGGAPLWRVQLPGVGFVLFADNPEVLGTRPFTVPRVNDDAGGPLWMPQLLGFPIDGRVYVVDTTSGSVLRELEPDREDRMVVAGGRVLRVIADARDGSCYFTVVASDAATGSEVWRQTGLNVRTADAGCAQRKDPLGHENVLAAVAYDGREILVDAYDGRAMWIGGFGTKVAATDSRHALIRSADGRTVSGIVLGATGVAWSRPVHRDAQIALARYAAIVVDREAERVIALDPATGAELVAVRTSATVAAVGPDGMILVDRREIGYVVFSGGDGGAGDGPAPGGPGGDPGGGGPGPGDPSTGCHGPKREQCPPGAEG
jgi:outer membrane protein assembly factor BamB